jgi:DNA-binding cell septation regulator SpoVG
MNITKVQIHLNRNQSSNVKAWADIILEDEFIIRDLTIIKAEDDTHYVNMPSKERKDHSRQDIAHPLNEKCRLKIYNTVLDEYEICTICHEYTLRYAIDEGTGKQLEESWICSNPNCESNQ